MKINYSNMPPRNVNFKAAAGYSIHKDGMEFVPKFLFCANTFINIVKFDKPKSVLEGLQRLLEIPQVQIIDGKKYYFLHRGIPNLLKCADDIEQSTDLNKIGVKGLCGAGETSIALETEDSQCLKLSLRPNAPLIDSIFDIPRILKSKIALRKPVQAGDGKHEFLYYTIEKKGGTSTKSKSQNKTLET